MENCAVIRVDLLSACHGLRKDTACNEDIFLLLLELSPELQVPYNSNCYLFTFDNAMIGTQEVASLLCPVGIGRSHIPKTDYEIK